MLKYYNPFCWMGFCNWDDEHDRVKVHDIDRVKVHDNDRVKDSFVSSTSSDLHFYVGHFLAFVQIGIILTHFWYTYKLRYVADESPLRLRSSVTVGIGNEVAETAELQPIKRRLSTKCLFQTRESMMGDLAEGQGLTTETPEAVPRFMTLHQFPRGIEAPTGIDALRTESIIRILQVEHEVSC